MMEDKLKQFQELNKALECLKKALLSLDQRVIENAKKKVVEAIELLTIIKHTPNSQ